MGSVVAMWTDEYVRKRAPIVGITQKDKRTATETLRQDMHPHQQMARDLTVIMVGSVLQLAYRKRLASAQDDDDSR
ncbi:hypothetical protein EV178_002532 [Coemansia sp. RSA 1646]|nr:hypothetical protein EV178_002532 [Coemansia sp. RSA 1646]